VRALNLASDEGTFAQDEEPEDDTDSGCNRSIRIRRSLMGRRYTYRVIIERGDGRYHVEIPALPGLLLMGLYL